MKTIETTFKNGNYEIRAIVTSSTEWNGGENSRIYHKVECTKRNIISSLYEVTSGKVNGQHQTIVVDGRTFGYDLFDCNSHSKRYSATEAVQRLIEQIIAA